MGTKEKYDTIINTIEELAQGQNSEGVIESLRTRDISEIAFAEADCNMMDDNSKNVLFMFLMGKRVIEYIQERKMVAAYKMIVSNEWDRNTLWNAMVLCQDLVQIKMRGSAS